MWIPWGEKTALSRLDHCSVCPRMLVCFRIWGGKCYGQFKQSDLLRVLLHGVSFNVRKTEVAFKSAFKGSIFGQNRKALILKSILQDYRGNPKACGFSAKWWRGTDSCTAGAPLEPCHHFRAHKTDQGHSRGHSEAMVYR